MKTKKTSTEKSAKNSGFRSLLPCAKGYWLPSFLTPIFIVLEVTMEVFIPLLMAAIVDGGFTARLISPFGSIFRQSLSPTKPDS